MEAKQVILTRQLPKTGALPISPPIDYDDGYYQVGWWKGRDYDTNKTRFISKTIDEDDIVIDRATGLMWAADGNELGCFSGVTGSWLTAIMAAHALNFAGFSDWRIPNIHELSSIVDFSKDSPSIDEVLFPNTVSDMYWSSTSRNSDTNWAWRITFIDGNTYVTNKLTLLNLRCVRGGV